MLNKLILLTLFSIMVYASFYDSILCYIGWTIIFLSQFLKED